MEIARVDLRGVVPGEPGWETARAAVTASVVAHGFVFVVHDALDPDLHRALFARALPELFALPLEVKQRTFSTKDRLKGYLGPKPGETFETGAELSVGKARLDGQDPPDPFVKLCHSFESLSFGEATNVDSVREFANILWPEGNPEFCERILPYAKNMLKLEQMVETLVLEGLGVREESIRRHFDMVGHFFRMSHYGAPQDTETSINMQPHCDDTMATMIVQHEVEGLEVHVGDGRWFAVPPEPGTVAFLAGEQLTVATNGRVPACLHRVRTPSSRERFSVLFGPRQKDGVTVRPLDDLVDAKHPLLYNPLKHEEYTKWRYSEEGFKFENPLKVYCGVEKDGATVMV